MLPLILVVEDDVEFQELYTVMLEDVSSQVMRAFDVAEARTILRQHRPDLVIVDMLLDESAGDEIVRDMQCDPAQAGTPIIIATVLSQACCQDTMETTSGISFLRKPFCRKDLLDAIKKSLPGAVSLDSVA